MNQIKKKLNIDLPKKKFFDFVYIDYKNKIYNRQLVKMWKRKFNFLSGYLLDPISRVNKLLPGWRIHTIEALNTRDRDVDNLDAKIALARVEVARANFGIADAARSPELDGVGDVSEKSQSKSVSGDRDTGLYSSIGLDISWEIDIFGYVRRSIEAADAQLERSVEAYRDVMVILYAEIAKNYVALRTAQERLQYALENVKSQKDTLRIVNARYKAELVSEVDLLQSEQNLAAAESNIPLFFARINELSNGLAILLGKNPGTLKSELNQSYGIPHVPEKTVVKVPREILRQRPDIREAERLLAQETAEVGIATAEEYPRFNLNGTFGYDSKDFDNQFSSDSRYWSFGPNFRWNIFAGGATQAAI